MTTFPFPFFSRRPSVAFDAKSTAASTFSGVTSATSTTMTVGTGVNRVLLVGVSFYASPTATTVSGITWGAQSMTKIQGVTGGVGAISTRGELWGLVNPTSGNQTITVTLGSVANTGGVITAASFNNANQTGGTTTFYNSGSNTGAGATTSITITSSTLDAAMDCLADAATTPTSPTQTQIAAASGGGSSYNIGSASAAFQWSSGDANGWVETGTAILHA